MRDRGGFTLVEVLFAMVIMATVIAAVYTVFLSQQKAHLVQDEVNEMQANARAGLELMANDLRNASAFVYADSSLVSLQENLDDDSAVEGVKYNVVSSIMKREYRDPYTSTSPVTLEMDINVTNLSFTYYDYKDAALTTPVAAAYLGSIRRVLISFSVYSPKAAANIGNTSRKRTFQTSVTPRNLWLTSY